MRIRQLVLPIVIAATAAACVPLSNFSLTAGTGRLEVRTHIQSGSYRSQALVSPWTASDVEHVEIRLLALSASGEESPALVNGQGIVQDIPKTSLATPFTLTGLSPNTRYRLRARAFKAPGLQSADLINLEAASFVDVTVLADDRPQVATLSIPLKDVPFAGQGAAPIAFQPGSLAPAGTESLQLGATASE